MKLTSFGHAAFLIETEGNRIILDPYRWPEAGGYLPIDVSADLVVVSHENDRYHSHLDQIKKPFDVLRAMEFPQNGQTWRGITFHGMHVYENAQRLPEDEVTIIHFTAEGLRVAFLGDLGHPLSDEEIAELRGTDIMLAATGGAPTIDLLELRAIIDAITPRVVVPMHYRIEGKINLNILPLERFAEVMADWEWTRFEGGSAELSRQTLPHRPTVYALNPTR